MLTLALHYENDNKVKGERTNVQAILQRDASSNACGQPVGVQVSNFAPQAPELPRRSRLAWLKFSHRSELRTEQA